ncbi:MAG TPA: hypothetical protein VFD43_09250 [Planctomycetota bacterium]|nr:hypothetical protein [Planctomycetota bacterium]
MLLSRLVAPLAILSCLAAPAASQFTLFNWDYEGCCGVGGVDADAMGISGSWFPADDPGFQGFLATAPVHGVVRVNLDHYSAFDGVCDASVPVYVINGAMSQLAECSTSDQDVEFIVLAGSEFGFGLKTNFPTWPGFVQFDEFEFEPLSGFDYWTDLGGGHGGLLGAPVLSGVGLLHAGMPVTIGISNAAPHSAATVIIGFSALQAPFKSGVMVPTPDLIISGLFIGMGTLDLAATWPPGLPPGVQLWMQVWIADQTAPLGLSATNGLRAATP